MTEQLSKLKAVAELHKGKLFNWEAKFPFKMETCNLCVNDCCHPVPNGCIFIDREGVKCGNKRACKRNKNNYFCGKHTKLNSVGKQKALSTWRNGPLAEKLKQCDDNHKITLGKLSEVTRGYFVDELAQIVLEYANKPYCTCLYYEKGYVFNGLRVDDLDNYYDECDNRILFIKS